MACQAESAECRVPNASTAFLLGIHTWLPWVNQTGGVSLPLDSLPPSPLPISALNFGPKKNRGRVRQRKIFASAAFSLEPLKAHLFCCRPFTTIQPAYRPPPYGYSQHLSTNHHLPTHSFHSHSSCFASFCGLWIVACFHVISELPTY